MKTKEAVSRLSYTIAKGNKPNETDKVALNALIKFINNSDKEVVQENLLFAKLYTIVLSDFLLNYKDIDFANGSPAKLAHSNLTYDFKHSAVKNQAEFLIPL